MQKEFIQIFRDRRTLLLLLTMPMLQLFLLSYAMAMNVDHIPLIVADQSLDAASHAYVDAMTVSGYFDIVGYVAGQADVVRAIDEGRAQAGLVIPVDFATGVARGEAQVLFLVDGSSLFTSLSAYNAATAIAETHAIEVLMERVERLGLLPEGQSLLPLAVHMRVLYNPNLNDIWFMLPGTVAMLLQTQSIALTTAAIVREREMGTLEQLLVTPIRSGELMVGKMAPNVLIALFNMLTVIGVGILWFKVPFQGDFWLFFGLSLIYIVSGLGLGLLISTVSQNQKQAQQLVGMVLLLGAMLGGYVFPRYTMPPIVRGVSTLFPLTYFVPIARGIMTKGIGYEFLWREILTLSIYAVLVMAIAVKAFKQRLE
jgi:ABC-2 type transport system permease protein